MNATTYSEDHFDRLAQKIGEQFATKLTGHIQTLQTQLNDTIASTRTQNNAFHEETRRQFETFIEDTDARNNIVQQNIDILFTKHLRPLQNRLDGLETDVKTIKIALIDTNRNLQALTKHTKKLEHFTEDVTDLGVRMTILERAHA